MTTDLATIQLRRGTASQFTTANAVYALGEPCLEEDTGKLKFGDGTTAWTSLPYYGAAFAQKASNGSDFADAGTTRANLHVPSLTPVACVATSNVALTGLQTIDGYTLVAGDLALLTAQSTSSQNGLWLAASGSWTRPTEFATGVLARARTVAVIQGTVNGKTTWLLQTNAQITVDTTAQTWVKTSAATGLPSATSAFQTPVWNGSAWESDLVGCVDICAEFGVSTSNSDNSTAINTALSTLGPLGLKAFISKPGVYAIQNPIIIGNGTSGTQSTWSAMLKGAGMPGGASLTNSVATVETKIQWTGAAGLTDAMVQVVGPLTGWSLENLRIDGGTTSANAPAWGLHMTSAVKGRVDNVTISGCQSGIHHDSYAAGTGGLTGAILDNIFNQFRNISIQYIGKLNTKTFGILFDGSGTGANTCYDTYDGLWFTCPGTSLGGTTISNNIYFKRCDSLTLRNITNDTNTGTDANWKLFYDWTGTTQWPKGCLVDKIDFGVTSAAVSSAGTPAVAPSMASNSVINISAANLQPGNPAIPWLRWGNGTLNGIAVLVAGTVTVANTACQPGSFIRVTNLLAGGTVGALSVGTRTTGSFVINSTSGTDTSSIFWEIVGGPF